MREWILENALASEEELDEIEAKSKQHVKESRQLAWEHYITPIKERVSVAVSQLEQVIAAGGDPHGKIAAAVQELQKNREPLHRDIHKVMGRALTWAAKVPAVNQLKALYDQWVKEGESTYAKHLYNEGAKSALQVPVVPATFDASAANINGYEVLNQYFDQLFATNSKVVAFGEDVGFIGDVNQGFAGLQQKHGALRISDTGIRELTIMGQGMGLALRGLRPIAEIQYLDYLLYGLQPLSDDAATTHWRTNGMQSCPIIVRSRGHRLEGVWHSGSPMGMIINSLRGFHICVPRNMVQAVGMYNTLLQSNDPALMIECLNGYRLKEKLPQNLLAYTVPLGIPEVVRTGADITIVSYGSTLRIVEEAAEILAEQGIDCEIVDVQTLLPFDIHHQIVESLKKTNRILFVDEDVPGGAAAFMFTKVMEEQGGYRWLDVAPKTLTGKAHRPAYGSDGDYFSKPNVEDVLQTVLTIMAE